MERLVQIFLISLAALNPHIRKNNPTGKAGVKKVAIPRAIIAIVVIARIMVQIALLKGEVSFLCKGISTHHPIDSWGPGG